MGPNLGLSRTPCCPNLFLVSDFFRKSPTLKSFHVGIYQPIRSCPTKRMTTPWCLWKWESKVWGKCLKWNLKKEKKQILIFFVSTITTKCRDHFLSSHVTYFVIFRILVLFLYRFYMIFLFGVWICTLSGILWSNYWYFV